MLFFADSIYIFFQCPFCSVFKSNWFSLIQPKNQHPFQHIFSCMTGTVWHYRGGFKKCCTMKSVFLLDREIILPPYIYQDHVFLSQWHHRCGSCSFCYWLIHFSAPHQTNEIPAYDKNIIGISSCLTLFLALLNADWFPEHHASGSSGSSQCPDRVTGNCLPSVHCPQKVPAASVVVVAIQCTYCYSHLQYTLSAEMRILQVAHKWQFLGTPFFDTLAVLLINSSILQTLFFKPEAWIKIYSF